QSSDGVRSPGARPTCRPACRSSTLLAAFCMPEEDPMTRDELVELSDLNYAEAMRDLSRRAGGTVLDEDGLLLFTGGHPLPVLASATMRPERRLGAGEVLERARAFFGARGRGFTVLVRAHADTDLAGAAADAGLLAMGEMPAMVLQRRLADAVAPRGVDLSPVTTREDVAAYGQVMGAAYATYGMPEDVLPSMLGNLDTLRAPHIVAFVAGVGGRPGAGARTVAARGVAGISWSARRGKPAGVVSPSSARERQGTRASISAAGSPRCKRRRWASRSTSAWATSRSLDTR